MAKMETTPVCHRAALKRLIDSCSMFTGDKSAGLPVEVLEQVKDLYAARLAICELDGTETELPAKCSNIMMITLDTLRNDYEKSKSGQLAWFGKSARTAVTPCIKALHEKNQWWTSYSNSRRDAVTFCQASRSALEKDEMLNTYREMTNVASMTGQALSDMIHENEAERVAMTHAVDMFQETISADMARMMQENKGMLDFMLLDFGAVIRGAQEELSMVRT